MTVDHRTPTRRWIDRAVRLIGAFALGWVACTDFYGTHRIPALEENSRAWVRATQSGYWGALASLKSCDAGAFEAWAIGRKE